MQYKKILQTLEHVVLIAVLAGTVGFYIGNRYGTSHVSLDAVKTTVTASK